MKQIFVVGRVGNDAEVTYTQSGIPVAKFSIAVDNGKDKEGERKAATWFKANLWRERAEKLAQYIKKGSVVAVSGDVECRAWIDKNSGEARCQMEINVNQFTFGGGKNDSAEAPKPQAVAAPPAQSAAPIADDGDDIPF